MRPRQSQAHHFLDNRINIARETPRERRERERRSLQVARQMLANGCAANAVERYTGLSEEALRQL